MPQSPNRNEKASASADDGEAGSDIWGVSHGAGFQLVPHALLKNQARLKLSALDILIVLNISLHWWKTGNLPYPKIETIAKRIGVARRSVERRIRVLERRGLIQRMRFEVDKKGKKIRRFDFSNLVKVVEYHAKRDPFFNYQRVRTLRDKDLAATDSISAAGRSPDVH